jgi:hypothetical protein
MTAMVMYIYKSSSLHSLCLFMLAGDEGIEHRMHEQGIPKYMISDGLPSSLL